MHYIEHDAHGDETRFLALRCVGVLASSLLCGFLTTFVVPECSGGGVLAVKVCLLTESAIPLKVGLWRFFITSVYLGFGNTLGAEAPTLHIAAAISCFLFDLSRMVVPKDTFPEGHVNTMVMIACTCGVACAFDTPFGGLMYCTEEFLHGSSGNKTFMLLLTINVMVAVIVKRKLMPNTSFFGVELDNGGESDLWMFFSMPCGILGALCSVVFFRLSLSIKDSFSMFYSHYWYELEHGEILTSDEEESDSDDDAPYKSRK